MYKIVPVKPVTPELVLEAKELANMAGALEEKIVDRIHYIMTSVFKLFNKNNYKVYLSSSSREL